MIQEVLGAPVALRDPNWKRWRTCDALSVWCRWDNKNMLGNIAHDRQQMRCRKGPTLKMVTHVWRFVCLIPDRHRKHAWSIEIELYREIELEIQVETWSRRFGTLLNPPSNLHNDPRSFGLSLTLLQIHLLIQEVLNFPWPSFKFI